MRYGRRGVVLVVAGLLCLSPAGPIAWAGSPSAAAPSAEGPQPLNAPAAGGAFLVDRELSREINPQDMFVNATPVVKTVMVMLVMASMASWMLLVVKALEIRGLSRSLGSAITELDECGDLNRAHEVEDPAAHALVSAARDEFTRSLSLVVAGAREGMVDRAEGRLKRIEAAHSRRIGFGLGLFAVVGSVAPFVGLFGTVWGIMHSFIGIAQSHVTSLAVVAPGIAEALLATSLGLVAAIPATVMYNTIGRAIQNYKALLMDCAIIILGLVSLEADALSVRGGATITSIRGA